MSEENKKNPEASDEISAENAEQLKDVECDNTVESAVSDESSEREDNAEITEREENEDENHENSEHTRRKTKVSLSTLVCSCVALCLAAVMLTYTVCNGIFKEKLANAALGNAAQGESVDDSLYSELAILEMIFRMYSFEELDSEEIETQLLKAFVYATGDRYAEYYTIDEYLEMVNSSMLGNSVGIGVKVVEGEIVVGGSTFKVMRIVDVVKDSPAYESGVLAGDCVVAIGTPEDNATLNALGYDVALNRLRGEKGTVAEFAVYRPQGDNYELVYFNITRDEYVDYSVTYKVADSDVDPEGKTGIIRISSFNHTTPGSFDEAVESLKALGCDKFIFDVRDNPGGELSSIVAVLSRFLDQGDTLISTSDNAGNVSSVKVSVVPDDPSSQIDCPVSKDDIGKYKDLNCVVMCNEYTASAAELFVANFRDYNIAQVVGVTTYGKGTVQRYLPLMDHNIPGVLKMTMFKYFPPCGEGYDGIGIVPHVTVTLSDEARKYNSYEILGTSIDNQLIEAIKHFK